MFRHEAFHSITRHMTTWKYKPKLGNVNVLNLTEVLKSYSILVRGIESFGIELTRLRPHPPTTCFLTSQLIRLHSQVEELCSSSRIWRVC